jgi:hypothetical protein
LHLMQFHLADPWFGDELAQQLSYHARVAEQTMVQGVMIGHSHALSAGRPQWVNDLPS